MADDPEWRPVKVSPLVGLASLRLHLVRKFKKDATSLQEDQEQQETITNRILSDMLCDIDSANKEEAHVTRFWRNPYGVAGEDFAPPALCRAAIQLAENTYGRVLSAQVSGSMSAMEFVAEKGKIGTIEHLDRFRDYFTGFISPLRALHANFVTFQSLSLIAQFDLWVSYLLEGIVRQQKSENSASDATSAKRRSKEPRRISAQERIAALTTAIKSSEQSRKKAKELSSLSMQGEKTAIRPSVLFDLFDYQSLSNMLEARANLVLLNPEHRSELRKQVKEENFFARASRWCSVFPWRVEEPLHALLIAGACDDENTMTAMIEFGGRLLEANARVLAIASEDPTTITKHHPVLLLKEPVFRGGDRPSELDHLKEYVNTLHLEVLENFDLRPHQKARRVDTKAKNDVLPQA